MAAASGLGPLAESVRSKAVFPPGPLLVALSGGADSAVLAWAASQQSEPVRAVFADHGLPASGQLRQAAAAVADALELPFDAVEAPVRHDAPSFEDAARVARYSALETSAKPDETILTGHTADDQAETVLGHFLRGAGAAGLAGIPARRGRLARPLLAVTRAETRSLAAALALPFIDDPDNESERMGRNRLRSELIPFLEREYNPQLRSVLNRTASALRADDAALEALAARIPMGTDGEVFTLPAAALAVVPEAVAARAVRRTLRQVGGPHAGSHRDVSDVLEVAAGHKAGAQLTGAVRVEREGPMVVLSTAERPPVDAITLRIPAEVAFDRWRLTLSITDRWPGPPMMGARAFTLDAGAVTTELVARPAGNDDRIDIGTGSKPVRDALAEAGVPRRLRRRWPVIESDNRVALIPGVRAAAWAWPGPTTVYYLVARIDTTGTSPPGEGT